MKLPRPRSGILLIMFSAFVLFLSWASYSELDKITRGEGKVAPSKQTQIIQSYEGGLIKRILVKEGDIVEKNQPLVEIDQSTLVSQYKETQQQYYAAFAKAVRLAAEINGTVPTYSTELQERATAIVTAQLELYRARQTQLESELNGLHSELLQRQQELVEIDVAIDSDAKNLASYSDELKMLQPLIDKGIEPQITLLQEQRSITELQGKMDGSRQARIRLMSAVQEVQDKIKAAKDKFRADALGDLTTVTGQISELDESLPALKDRVERTEIRSPIKGVVNRILATTIGGVAQSAMPLMEIIPLEDTLLIETRVDPKDIAFITPGQKALVKITAYDFSRYGGLSGTVVNISADAVHVGKEDSKTAYIVRITTDKNYVASGNEKLYIVPGMIAEVNIVTGKRSILNYLLAPVLKMKENALRE